MSLRETHLSKMKMCSTIFTLTSLTSNPQFWHVPIQPSLFYTFRNYILRNSRHFFSSPFLHHSFCFIYKNYFSQSLKQKHLQFCLNTHHRMRKTWNWKCSIKTKCEIKKNFCEEFPHWILLASSKRMTFSTSPQSWRMMPTEHRLHWVTGAKPAVFESRDP